MNYNCRKISLQNRKTNYKTYDFIYTNTHLVAINEMFDKKDN